MRYGSRRFVRSAPSKVDRNRLVDLRVTDMTAGDALWWDARMGPAGGDALLEVYARCGLLRLPPQAELPPPVRRPNDGRYFYADEAVAEALAAALDARR